MRSAGAKPCGCASALKEEAQETNCKKEGLSGEEANGNDGKRPSKRKTKSEDRVNLTASGRKIKKDRQRQG